MNTSRSFIVLAFFMIFVGFSNGIICYVCQNCAEPADYNEYTNNTCPGYCMKIFTYVPTMGSYVYKACTSTCKETDYYFGFSRMNVKCCNNVDRCNSGQHSTSFNQFSQLVMTLACVSFSFLKLF